MAKKDFSAANTGRVYANIAEATAAPAEPEAQPAQEVQEAPAAEQTQEPRIVMGRYGIPHVYKEQTAADEAEQQQRAAEMRTQGRKGCAAARINMAFSAENYEFIKIMAGVTGQSLTQFCNLVFDRYREEHPELYERAKAIKDSL